MTILSYTPEGFLTRYHDGAFYGAHPHHTPHYHEITARCGYGDDVLAFCREHELAHHFMGGSIIYNLAHQLPVDRLAAAQEEALVQMFQRWARAGEMPIIEHYDWHTLRSDFIQTCGQLTVALTEAR